jgi:signal transduction histidine kinase
MMASLAKPRFHNRLVVRYAVVMALTMLLFDQLSDRVHGLVLGFVDVPETFIVGPGGGQPIGADALPFPGFELAAESAFTELEIDVSSPPVMSLHDAEILTPAEAAAVRLRLQRTARVISWTTTLVISLLLGGALSWLVTSRLERLTLAVAVVPGDGEVRPPELPRKLLEGKDEIAQLARVFVDSRRRIASLLEQLAERDRTRREWIAHASHDLRTPLTALFACLDRADELHERGGHELAEVLAAARSDCDRLHELTGDLLALARLEAEETFTPEPVLAGELATRACKGLMPLAAARELELVLDLGTSGSAHLSFDGDGRGILRVLENLLRNALDHARGRVELCVTREVEERAAVIRFEIRDDGRGFGTRLRADEESNGIGLRVARRFVELHGGSLEVDSSDEGACVAFVLPASSL